MQEELQCASELPGECPLSCPDAIEGFTQERHSQRAFLPGLLLATDVPCLSLAYSSFIWLGVSRYQEIFTACSMM